MNARRIRLLGPFLAICLLPVAARADAPQATGTPPASGEATATASPASGTDAATRPAADATRRDRRTASAADPLRWGDQADRRALNGHFFLPSEVVLDPFTSTHFGTTTAFGYGRFDVQIEDENGNVEATRLKIAALQQSLELQVQLGQAGPASFAVRMRAAGNASVGVDAQSALYLPISVGYDYGLGLLVKPWGNRYFQFGLSFDFARGTTYQVTPLQAVSNSIQAGALTSKGLLTAEDATRLAPALALALSPYRLVGLVTTLRYSWDHVDGGDSFNGLDWGIALGLDLGAVSKVPLGIQGIYRLEKALDGEERLLHYGGGGLFYTGREHLALGLEVQATRSSPANGVEQLLVMGQFRFRYYW